MRYTATLPSGLKIVMERAASRAVYCGIVVRAGTRHEAVADSGMAHFVEHMVFKGTHRRTARQITGILERRGGDLSAFTSKQETVYYANVMPEDFSLAADVLCDIVFNSVFPQKEIPKEAEVICDEIESYRDSPAELIFDDFESLLFPGQPLGRDVLGDPATLRRYTTADALRFTAENYFPANCIFYLVGDIDFKQAERAIAKAMAAFTPFAGQGANGRSGDDLGQLPAPQPAPAFVVERNKSTHQAHVVVGTATFGGNDPQHAALQLLNNIVGGPAPNSRLNLALRERAGLVYSVDSYASTYPDTGLWAAYFGCDPGDVKRCLSLFHRELRRLTEKPLPAATLAALKRQYTRQVRLTCDNFESYALALGKSFAHYGRHRDIDNFCREIDAITPDALHRVACEILSPDRLSTLIYR